jgi:hypothetical protein
MNGRKRSAVMGIIPDCPPCLQEAQVVRSNLAAIGIRVRISEYDNPWNAAIRGAAIDLLDSGTELDFADSPRYLLRMFTEAMSPSWLPAGVREAVDRVLRLTDPERGVRAAALADRLVAEEVPVAAVGVGVVGEFLSPRLGCRVFPPLGFGVDLAALCVSDPGG